MLGFEPPNILQIENKYEARTSYKHWSYKKKSVFPDWIHPHRNRYRSRRLFSNSISICDSLSALPSLSSLSSQYPLSSLITPLVISPFHPTLEVDQLFPILLTDLLPNARLQPLLPSIFLIDLLPHTLSEIRHYRKHSILIHHHSSSCRSGGSVRASYKPFWNLFFVYLALYL